MPVVRIYALFCIWLVVFSVPYLRAQLDCVSYRRERLTITFIVSSGIFVSFGCCRSLTEDNNKKLCLIDFSFSIFLLGGTFYKSYNFLSVSIYVMQSVDLRIYPLCRPPLLSRSFNINTIFFRSILSRDNLYRDLFHIIHTNIPNAKFNWIQYFINNWI